MQELNSHVKQLEELDDIFNSPNPVKASMEKSRITAGQIATGGTA